MKIEEAINVYDAYAEIIPSCLNRLTSELKEFDFEVDLYGRKESYSKPFVITSRPVKKSIYQYERSMKPHEMNVIMNIQGEGFSLANTEDVIIGKQTLKAFLDENAYFYIPVFMTNMLIRILMFRLKNKIKAIFRHFIRTGA
jgi:hypothetical protein